MKTSALAVVLLPMLACASAQAIAQNRVAASTAKPAVSKAATKENAERHALVYKVVREWGPYVQAIHNENIRAWADRMVPAFRQADIGNLRLAAKANTFEGMINALTGQRAVNPAKLPGGIAPKTLGSTTGDLVFTPLASCNIVDTRNAGGAFTAGIQRHFKSSGANFTAQGGSDTNCGIPTNPTALLLGVTSVDAPNRGYFKMWPYSTPAPVSSATSYGPTQNSRNDIVLKVSQGLTNDFTMGSSTTGPHVLISVLGYFMAPEATALNCTTITTAGTALASTNSRVDAVCPAGYTATGGGCWGDIAGNAQIVRSANDKNSGGGNGWWCRFQNATASDISVSADATCCRVPGR